MICVHCTTTLLWNMRTYITRIYTYSIIYIYIYVHTRTNVGQVVISIVVNAVEKTNPIVSFSTTLWFRDSQICATRPLIIMPQYYNYIVYLKISKTTETPPRNLIFLINVARVPIIIIIIMLWTWIIVSPHTRVYQCIR